MSRQTELRWITYEDGSGYAESPFGHSMFGFDTTTDEIKYPDGKYHSTCGDWKDQANAVYAEKYYAREKEFDVRSKEGIYMPYFCDYCFTQAYHNCEFVGVDSSHKMLRTVFMNVVEQMRDLEDSNFSDSTTYAHTAAPYVAKAIAESSIEKSDYQFSFENGTVKFPVDSVQVMKPLPEREQPHDAVVYEDVSSEDSFSL